MSDKETIVVIGAGVIGLSAALLIQKRLSPSQSVTIVARDMPNTISINYATPWSGAHYRPVPGSTPQLSMEAGWAKRSYETFQRMARDEDVASGIKFVAGEEFFEKSPPEYVDAAADVSKSVYAHLAEKFEVLRASEVADADVTLGFRYWTYCVNSPVYIAYLMRKFVLNGGRTMERSLVALEEAFSLGNNVCAVVNCSGMGFGDPKSFIIRGQTCLVRNTCPKTITRLNADGSWSFAIPRPLNGGTIIGGTKQPHDWNPNPLPEIRRELLSRATKWFPFAPDDGKREFDVMMDIVGRRPAREGGPRVEAECVKVMDGKDGKRFGTVVHAYGLGGRGVELSWGVGEDVVNLLLKEGVLTERAVL